MVYDYFLLHGLSLFSLRGPLEPYAFSQGLIERTSYAISQYFALKNWFMHPMIFPLMIKKRCKNPII